MKSEGLEQGATVLLAASPRDARRCAGNQMSIVRARGRFRRAGCDRRRARRTRSPGLGWPADRRRPKLHRSEEHTSELKSLMSISYSVFCLKKKTFKYITYYE